MVALSDFERLSRPKTHIDELNRSRDTKCRMRWICMFDVSLMIRLFEFVLNPTSVRGTRVRAFAGTIEVETLGVQ